MNLFAVDLGAVSAFAFARGSERPVWGSIRFRAGSLESRNPDGLAMLELRRWLLGLIDRFQPDWIACEPPYVPQARVRIARPGELRTTGSAALNAQTVRRLSGYFMRTAELAAGANPEIGWLPCETWEVEKHFLGKHGHKSVEKKRLTQAQCRMIGWTPVNEHEADALAVLSCAQARLRLDAALLRGTMFATTQAAR